LSVHSFKKNVWQTRVLYDFTTTTDRSTNDAMKHTVQKLAQSPNKYSIFMKYLFIHLHNDGIFISLKIPEDVQNQPNTPPSVKLLYNGVWELEQQFYHH